MTCRLSWLAIVAMLACDPTRAIPPQTTVVRDSAGVEIVESSAPASWSPVVDGMRGRLILSPSDSGGRMQFRVELELQNVRDHGEPIEIWWGSFTQMMQFTLEDETGKELTGYAAAGNEIMGPPYWLRLPYRGSMRIIVSNAAYEYPPDGRTLLRPLVFQAWDLSAKRNAKLYLRARQVSLPSSEIGHRPWSGVLVLPRVLVP